MICLGPGQGPKRRGCAVGPGPRQGPGGHRPRKFWPNRAMIVALDKGSKGDKGVPIPYADAKSAPWLDTDNWSKGAAQPPKNLLFQYEESAKDLVFQHVGAELMARTADDAALKAGKMKLLAALWTAAVGHITHGLAMYGSPGPCGCSVATNDLAVLAETAAVQGHNFAID